MTKKRALVSLIILIILLICFIITFYLAVNKKPKSYQSKAYAPVPEASPSARFLQLSGEMDQKNARLRQLLENYQTADEVNKQSAQAGLLSEIKTRNQTQLSLLELSPYAVYQKAFDEQTLEQFPPEAQAALEKRTGDIKGRVKILHEDNFTQNASREVFFFTPMQSELNSDYLFYPTAASSYPYQPASFASETEITVKNGLVLDETRPRLVAVEIVRDTEPPAPDALGEQNLLVLLARYDDIGEAELPTPDEIETSFKKISDFYDQNSYGRFALIPGIVKKWYVLGRPKEETAPDIKISLGFEDIYKNVLTQFYEDNNVLLQKYKNQRFAIVSGDNIDFGHDQSWIGKSTAINLKNSAGQIISLGKISQAIIYLSPENRPYFYETKPTADGQFSTFEISAIHELGHSINSRHARIAFPPKNTLLPDTPTTINGQTQFFDSEPDWDFAEYIRRNYTTGEYGNPYDAMGSGARGLHFNGYIKKYFNWIGDGSAGQYVRIDPQNPDGVYTLKLMGQEGVVAAWFPATETNPDDFFRVDYFLEYRRRALGDDRDEEGLAINLEALHQPPLLAPTFLFASPTRKNLFQKGEVFIDNWNDLCIKVKDINQQESFLKFALARLGTEQTFHLIPGRAGKNNISSVNVFESDLQNSGQTSINLTERFITENPALCDEKKYAADKNSINIKQGMLALSAPVFDEDVIMKPKSFADRSFSTAVRFNALVPDETTLSFSLSELPTDPNRQGPFTSQSLRYNFHLIPTPDEYKNDLEPFMIDIKDQNTNNKEFNHLETEKGQTLIFTSKIANNSRNPDGNQSSDFIMKWYLQDDKGNNIIPPHTQRHDGIPPKSIDEANPAIFTWTISQDMKAGNYKIILEVDPNNRLQEFNENNNMIWRYFSVM